MDKIDIVNRHPAGLQFQMRGGADIKLIVEELLRQHNVLTIVRLVSIDGAGAVRPGYDLQTTVFAV